MKKVNNKKVIRKLTIRSLKSSRLRNIIAVCAIILTTVLFTALFTIALSIGKSFEESNFRQVGGNSHGSFKDLTLSQVETLKDDSLIKESGVRILLGLLTGDEFSKMQGEVSYIETGFTNHYFLNLEKGKFPQKGSNEIATDTRVLRQLGIEPELGKEITLTYKIWSNAGEPLEVMDTFILSGYWEFDEASNSSHVITSKEYAKNKLENYYLDREIPKEMQTEYTLDVIFKSSRDIGKNMLSVLENHGYQYTNEKEENYINIGVNWGYMNAQFVQNFDPATLLSLAVVLLLIILSGYLIIYNIFHISVIEDIRFYGLLKTVGTTGKQIRKMIRLQGFILSLIGIPIGLLAGYLVGAVLTPQVVKTLNTTTISVSIHPLIFAISIVFSLFTIYLSCSKPARIAGKVSPVEAVKYTERKTGGRKEKKGIGGSKIYRMAFANLMRNKVRTILVVFSLAIAVLLFHLAILFTRGFDMDKYLRVWVSSDFIVAKANYFRYEFNRDESETGVENEFIDDIDSQGDITEKGKIYGQTTIVKTFVPENEFLEGANIMYGDNSEWIESMLNYEPRNEKDELPLDTELYGLEKFMMDKLRVVEGSLDHFNPETDIIEIIEEDDYGNPIQDQGLKLGEEVEIFYADEDKYVDARTGGEPDEDATFEYMKNIYLNPHTKKYKVAARATIPNTISYRRKSATITLATSVAEFIKETGSDVIMLYGFDMQEDQVEGMDEFLKSYTEQRDTSYDYESKQLYVEQFDGFKNMFVLMGGALSGILGIIGILNFVNANVTSIFSRRREFAVLQAVGMTGSQLQKMLMIEGCIYGAAAIFISLILSLSLNNAVNGLLEGMFWFFTPKNTLWPIAVMLPVFLVIGIFVPLIAYERIKNQSIVERIRAIDL